MPPDMLINQIKRFYISKKNRLFEKKNRMNGAKSGLHWFIKFDVITPGSFSSRKLRWGYTARFPKPLPCLRPNSANFLILLMTRSKIQFHIQSHLNQQPLSHLLY